MATAEFGQALHRWRDRVSPEAAGLPTGEHRRAAGLSREELAMLAAISVDYVTRLEQGRASNPSAQVVEPWPGPYGCWEPSARAPVTAHQACTDAYAGAQLAMTRNGQTVPLLGSTVTAPSIPGGGLP